MNIKKYIPIYILLVMTLMSCYKDDIVKINTTTVSKKHLPIDVSGDVIGIVHDEFGNMISDYTCTFMDQKYLSFYNGFYHFGVIDANKNGTILQIKKDIHKYQFSINPLDKDVCYFSHTIFTKPYKTTNNSSKNIEINLNTDISIALRGNAYMDRDQEYTGEVSIETFSPDLNNPIQAEALPGNHLALNSKNEDVWIDMYSAFFIGIRDIDNNKLRIKEDSSKVIINTDISDCEKCTVWRYDNSKSKWLEQTSIKNPNSIEFELGKSGFYCYGKQYIYNLVEGQISGSNTPLRNQTVDIFDNDDRFIQRVYTSNSGKWFAHLPMNKKYKYKFAIQNSNTFLSEFELDETDDIKLPVYDLTNISIVKLTGEIRNCNDELIKNSFFQLWQDSTYKCLFLTDSEVNLDVISFSDKSIHLQSANETWLDIGPRQSFYKIKSEINFNESYTCSQFKKDGYFKIKIDNKEKLLAPPVAIIENGRTKLEISDIDNPQLDTKIEIYFSGQEERDYDDEELNIDINNLIIDNVHYDLNCNNSTEGCGFKNFKIEYFGEDKGDWIKGNFKGIFWMKTYYPFKAEYKEVEAEFLIQRNFR